MFTRALLIIVLLITGSLSGYSLTETIVNNTLNELDREISRRDSYLSTRQERINRLKQHLDNTTDLDSIMMLCEQIGHEYTSYNIDSCLLYYTRGYDIAEQLGRHPDAERLRIKRAINLPLSGFISDAYNEYSAIDPATLPDSMMAFYHESGRQMYSYIASFHQNNVSGDYWREKEYKSLDEYIACNPVDDRFYTINLATNLIRDGKQAQARGLLEDYILTIPAESNLYARATHQLANLAHNAGDELSEKYYLATSAIADLKSAVLEVTSLNDLGVIMFNDNQIDRAYNYLSTALLSAVECHASVRMIEVSTALPLIQKAHTGQIASWRTRIYLVIVLLAVAMMMMIIMLLYLRYQMRRTSILKDRLASTNQLKDLYISQFFRLSSIYVEKMNQLCKLVNRKITSGQVDELYRITKSNKFVEEQTADFYHLFDDAFLNIYPDFVTRVNDLLNDKIILPEGEIMNNDLRILAFMRMGLNDTALVAQILNYSVNTVYAYRNKLRNRAINRDTFESDIMQIPSI